MSKALIAAALVKTAKNAKNPQDLQPILDVLQEALEQIDATQATIAACLAAIAAKPTPDIVVEPQIVIQEMGKRFFHVDVNRNQHGFIETFNIEETRG